VTRELSDARRFGSLIQNKLVIVEKWWRAQGLDRFKGKGPFAPIVSKSAHEGETASQRRWLVPPEYVGKDELMKVRSGVKDAELGGNAGGWARRKQARKRKG